LRRIFPVSESWFWVVVPLQVDALWLKNFWLFFSPLYLSCLPSASLCPIGVMARESIVEELVLSELTVIWLDMDMLHPVGCI